MDIYATCCDVYVCPGPCGCLLVMSDADQPRNAHRPHQNRSRSWIFSVNLNIQKPLTTEEGSDLISPDYFNKVINDCFQPAAPAAAGLPRFLPVWQYLTALKRIRIIMCNFPSRQFGLLSQRFIKPAVIRGRHFISF